MIKYITDKLNFFPNQWTPHFLWQVQTFEIQTFALLIFMFLYERQKTIHLESHLCVQIDVSGQIQWQGCMLRNDS